MLATLLSVACAVSAQAAPPAERYDTRLIAGFTVRVSVEARADPQALDPALELLSEKLAEINAIVPDKPLAVLKRIPIWVELNNPDFPCACYHPDRGWLRNNGYDLRKENSVEIANVRNFVTWTTNDQPMMVLHELAHGYHDIVFGYSDPYIAAHHRYAVAFGLYDSVQYHRGGERQAYAKTNPMEYFAELTEAYFGVNDFYPFNAEDLKQHDPKGYEMCRRIWGEPKARSSTLPRLWNQPPRRSASN